jgi:AcrR family transcriptional regulator
MSQIKRLRRPSAGGYARGDETRQRIIEAAIKLFGEHGFAGASTRDIAAAAGVNAPALQYYFENKEGVYQACVEYIVNDIASMFEPAMRRANEVLRNDDELPAFIEAFLAIQEVMFDCILLQPQAANRRFFLVRELAGEEPQVASKLMQRRLRTPMSKVSVALLSRITGSEPDDPVTRIRLISLKGQFMPFHYAPSRSLELLGWKEIDAAKGALLKTTLLAQTRILLESWAAAATRKS